MCFLQLQARNVLVSEELSDYSCMCEGLGLFSLVFDTLSNLGTLFMGFKDCEHGIRSVLLSLRGKSINGKVREVWHCEPLEVSINLQNTYLTAAMGGWR